MVYGTYNELVFMGFINHRSITGGPHLTATLVEGAQRHACRIEGKE